MSAKTLSKDQPTYFIADISANHDGSLDRARMLVRQAAEAGANAAKFQNFQAAKIVSERGFSSMTGQISHQAKWKKSVFQVYTEASIPWEWTAVLKQECGAAGIDYFST
ncbi:MAG: N-acetylneuraminate synthase family protein, partial [Terriglobales bacterium]